jgi:signal transduction protein with GAF and PtsI domain
MTIRIRDDELKDELKQAIDLLADLTEAYTAALFLPDREGNLKAMVWHTMSKSFRLHSNMASGESVINLVMKNQEPLDMVRSQQDAPNPTKLYSEEENIKAFLALPVGDFGVLVVDTKKRSVFTEREKRWVRDFAKFFAMLIEQRETSAREDMYGRILDLFYSFANAGLDFSNLRDYYGKILTAGLNFTGLSMGFLCLHVPEGGVRKFVVEAVAGTSLAVLKGRAFPINQGLIGWVMREVKPLFHSRWTPIPGKSFLISPDEPLRGYNAFIGVPLLAWRQLVGVLAFAGRSERELDTEEAQALKAAGHGVAETIRHFSG